MRQVILDAFEDNFSGNMNENLFPFIDIKSEVDVLDWLNKDMESKFRSRQTRLEAIRKLDAMFKGLPYTASDRTTLRDTDEELGLRRPKSIYNFINEMVEAKVSQRARFKPSITVIPNNVNIDDENRAESVKMLLTAKAQEIDLETILAEGDKYCFLSGEQYAYVRWNKNIGGIVPDLKAGLEKGLEPKYPDGTPITVAYRGDVDILVLGPDRAYHQLGKNRWCDVDDCNIITWIHQDILKAEYPDKKNNIHPTDSNYYNYFNINDRREHEYYCMTVEYFHRPTRFLPKGIYVRFIPGAILEMTDYPYKDGELPIVFDTDIDSQGEITGRPFTSNIEKLQRLHDMVSASMARGYAIANSPKWVYPKGSIDANKLTNQYSSLEFKGPQAPQLVTFNGVPSSSLDLLTWSEKSIEKASTVYGVSRGEPPKGIKAAVALQFLDEQELQRESRGMAKRQQRTLNIYHLMLSRIQQFYKPEDGRIFKYLGEDNAYLIKDFESMDISGEYDIKFENSSALPDSKTGKIAAIFDLNAATPQDPMFKKEQIAQILDLGNDRRFRSENLSGLKAAQFKLQKILNKEQTVEAREWDDFTIEYPIFVNALRQREFKGEDPQVMQALADYVKGMEYLMWQKAQMNPIFKQKIMMYPEYPIFYMVPMNPAPSVVPMPGQEDINANQQQVNQQGVV